MRESLRANEPIVELELEQASFEVTSSHGELSNLRNGYADHFTPPEDAVDVDCESCLGCCTAKYTHSVMHPMR